MAEFSPDMLPDLLPLYYKRLFPYGPYYRWLSYGNVKPSYFQNREFSFTLADDVYIRYLSFNNQDDLEKAIQKRCPHKIDIGAIYTTRPADHRRAGIFNPVEKELVFDIDMTDYDEIRTCCSGADICIKCWRFMAVATKVLDTALRDDFGFEHLLWVFSGRRGIHCWVCDATARALNQSARSAVAEYLQVVVGGENQTKKVTIMGDIMHPSIKRAVSIIEQEFEAIVEEQNILGSKDSIAKILKLITDDSLRNEAEKSMDYYSTPRERWKALVKLTRDFLAKGMLKRKSKFVIEEIMLQYAYPRLDINVSKGLNHLLKSPFCVHPKTGKVCTPFNPRAVAKFNPTTVPTLSKIIEEVKCYDDKQGELMTEEDKVSKVKDYKKTSMMKSVMVFNEFVRNLESTWKGKKIEESDRKMEF